MKWGSHRKITGKIGKHFGVEDTKALSEASILPDKEHDYRIVRIKKRGREYEKRVRLRHHLEPFVVNKIIEYAMEARRLKTRGDRKYIIPLGKAAHYIQDNVIDPRKKFLFFRIKSKKVHDEIEAKIDRLDVPFEEVYKVEKAKFTLSDFERELRNRKPTTDPGEAMKNATYLTAMLMKLVVRPEYPDDFWAKYRRAKIMAVAGALVGSVILSVGYFVSSFALAAAGCLLAVAAVTNPCLWRMRRDAKFFRGDL